MVKQEFDLKDIKDNISCPYCKRIYELGISVQELANRYTPYPIICFDGKPGGEGCMNFFEYFIYKEKLIVRGI